MAVNRSVSGDAGVQVGESTSLPLRSTSVDMSDSDVWLMVNRFGSEVLLTLAKDAGLGERRWCLPGGRPAVGELLIPAVVRYANEAAGLTVAESDVQLSTLVYWRDGRGVSRLALFFAAEHDPESMGAPRIGWPREYATAKWSSRGLLPPGTDRVCAAGIGLARRGISCAVLGPDGEVTCETWAAQKPRTSLTL